MGEKTHTLIKVRKHCCLPRETGDTFSFLQWKITLFVIDGWVTFVFQLMFMGIKNFWGVKEKKVEFKEGWIYF